MVVIRMQPMRRSAASEVFSRRYRAFGALPAAKFEAPFEGFRYRRFSSLEPHDGDSNQTEDQRILIIF